MRFTLLCFQMTPTERTGDSYIFTGHVEWSSNASRRKT